MSGRLAARGPLEQQKILEVLEVLEAQVEAAESVAAGREDDVLQAPAEAKAQSSVSQSMRLQAAEGRVGWCTSKWRERVDWLEDVRFLHDAQHPKEYSSQSHCA